MNPSIPIASDLSYFVLKARRDRGEMVPGPLDLNHQRLHRVSGYRAFIADVDEDGDRAQPSGASRIDVPQHTVALWHRHRKG